MGFGKSPPTFMHVRGLYVCTTACTHGLTAPCGRLLDALASSQYLMTVWSLHLFNLVLCLLLFLATKERRRRLERQAAAWPHCAAGVRPVQGPSFAERVSLLTCRAELT